MSDENDEYRMEDHIEAALTVIRNMHSDSVHVRVKAYNALVAAAAEMVGLLHPALSPQLVPAEKVRGNDYNPNTVPAPEMKLLRHSIHRDGVTMAVVVAPDPDDESGVVVVDGFHRTEVIKTDRLVADSLGGYIPTVKLDRDLPNLMASTVRHNMARGAHRVDLSSKLVAALTKHHWDNDKIGEELGMDPDEVLRMKQVTGLAEMFSDRDFSKAWE
jgi:ParB-like chromosome segregation protein Spo0J